MLPPGSRTGSWFIQYNTKPDYIFFSFHFQFVDANGDGATPAEEEQPTAAGEAEKSEISKDDNNDQ
jgi:hypothetical protein